MKERIWLALLSIAMVPIPASGQPCKQASFTGAVTSKDAYSHPFAPKLNFRLQPLKDDWGWVISIGGEDMSEDWTYPVTFPIRTGEQQVMGTGYGSTVQQKMTYPIVVEFVLTHADFLKYSKMADEALASTRAEAAGEFMDKLARLPQGQVTVKALNYGKGDTPETIKWMKFSVSVVVPASFSSNLVAWTPVSCPKQ
jgi:hypothetical protein